MDKIYQHILVPLDGSDLAEAALSDAELLAQLTQADITLLQIIPPIADTFSASTDFPVFLVEQWEANKEAAQQYLNDVAKQLQDKGITTVHAVTDTGLAAETIINYAQQLSVDLIVMATHGRSGMQRWVYGSVADKVLRGASMPVLLVRANPN